MKVIIAGGGIGGLVSAMSLHQAGIDVVVYESVHQLKPLGVGINILPHSVRVLQKLGLVDDLVQIAVPNRELVYFNSLGQRIWQEWRGLDAGYKYPQLSIHRGYLQLALLRQARERLGAGRIKTGHHLIGFRADHPDGVVAQFGDPETKELVCTETADVLIGADGIHSTVRSTLNPNDGPPKWTGRIMFRGVSETAPFLTGRSHVAIGGNPTFVAYPISPEHLRGGRSLTNWIAGIRVDPSQGYDRIDWNREADLSEVAARFKGWEFGWLNVPKTILSANAVFEYPMIDKDPLERWTCGRVTLLGDAAHPMYPVGSNGASQAILDAEALTEELTKGSDIGEALHRYESRRRPATAQIVESNRQGGPEGIISLAEKRAPNGFDSLDEVFQPGEIEEFMARYKRVAQFDLEQVNR